MRREIICIDRGIGYIMRDGQQMRAFKFMGMTIFMPMNSIEEEIEHDRLIKEQYGNDMPTFVSVPAPPIDPDDDRDLIYYNNDGVLPPVKMDE